MELKPAAISISMLVFVLSSMLGMGLGLRVSDILAPLRNWRLVMLSLVANFIVMPFAALALARVLGMDERSRSACCCSAWRAARRSCEALTNPEGQSRVSVGLMVLLMVITVAYLPLVFPLLLPGVSVDPAQIAQSLVLLMLLPLGGALAVNANLRTSPRKSNRSSTRRRTSA